MKIRINKQRLLFALVVMLINAVLLFIAQEEIDLRAIYFDKTRFYIVRYTVTVLCFMLAYWLAKNLMKRPKGAPYKVVFIICNVCELFVLWLNLKTPLTQTPFASQIIHIAVAYMCMDE